MAASTNEAYKQIAKLLQGIRYFHDNPTALSYGQENFYVNKTQALRTLRSTIPKYREMKDQDLINHLHDTWVNSKGPDVASLYRIYQEGTRGAEVPVEAAQVLEQTPAAVAVAEQPKSQPPPADQHSNASSGHSEAASSHPNQQSEATPEGSTSSSATAQPVDTAQEASPKPTGEPVSQTEVNNSFTTSSKPEVVKAQTATQTPQTPRPSMPVKRLPKIQPPQFALNGWSKFKIWAGTTRFPIFTLIGAGAGAIGGFSMGGILGAGLGAAGGAVLGKYVSDTGNPYQNYPVDNAAQINPAEYQQRTGIRLPNFRSANKLLRKGASKLGKQAAKQIAKEGLIVALDNPISLAVLGIAIGIPVLFLITNIIKTNAVVEFGGGGTSTTAPQSAIILTKTGPASVDNGQNITYTLNATYTGNGTADIEVVDHLPDGGSAQTPSEGGTIQNNTITWELKGMSSNQSKTLTFTFVPNPGKTNFWLANYAEATIKNQTGGSGGNSQFDSLMAGQGRNTGVLGDENNFVSTVMKNAANGGFPQLSSQEANIRAIYQTSIAHNVNPLIVLTIWGVEQTFTFQSPEFGCKLSGDNNFNSQLNCSAVTLDHWMNDFNQNQHNGSLTITSSNCTYTDAFLYAYEVYTPVCHAQDHNESSRSVFTSIYTKLLGK